MVGQAAVVIDDAVFSALEAVLDDGICLCGMIADAEGRALDYRFLRVSRNFEAMTGLRGAEGRTALDLVPTLERSWIETYGRVGLGRETVRFSQGSVPMGRVFEVHAVPVEPAPRFAILFRDVTALRRIEDERARALEAAQHLLRELNHRVMNSFAAISAITAMEARAADEGSRPALQRLQGRVQALGALYRRLEGAARADRIEVAEYLAGNVAALRDAAGAGPGGVPVAVACDLRPLALPTAAAVPLALVLNELLTAALGRGPGAVRVSLDHEGGQEGGQARLVVEDDAPGDPAAPLGAGIGAGLVGAFAGELGAAIRPEAGPGGTRVEVAFPVPEEAGA
jgi:two-component sensor histidine kinase